MGFDRTYHGAVICLDAFASMLQNVGSPGWRILELDIGIRNWLWHRLSIEQASSGVIYGRQTRQRRSLAYC